MGFFGLFGGFNPSKCKTALRLCIGRIKLLKNKKGLAARALRKEIADLLGADKTESARVRIEGVMREEANLEAFDILDLFCELLVVRLRLIEQEKDLPDDLKEAVATCIYAAKRMGELPELGQIKSQFAAKYGREYAQACEADGTAAACGVNRTAIQKLSVAPPTNEEKLAKLRAIAEEHRVPFDEEEATKSLAQATKSPNDRGNVSGESAEPPLCEPRSRIAAMADRSYEWPSEATTGSRPLVWLAMSAARSSVNELPPITEIPFPKLPCASGWLWVRSTPVALTSAPVKRSNPPP